MKLNGSNNMLCVIVGQKLVVLLFVILLFTSKSGLVAALSGELYPAWKSRLNES